MDTRAKFLSKLPRNGIVAEIGVAKGMFSEEILKISKPKKLYLVDCWEHQNAPNYKLDPNNVSNKEQKRRYDLVKEKFKDKANVFIRKGYSSHVAKKFPNHFFDWVYLDANHTYNEVKRDLSAWYPKIKKGGIISGHDYKRIANFPIGVIPAVDEFIKNRNLEMFLIDDDPWRRWAIRRRYKHKFKEKMDLFWVHIKRSLSRSAAYDRIYNRFLLFKEIAKRLI